MRPRSKRVFEDLSGANLRTVDQPADAVAAVRQLCGGAPSITIDGPPALCAELTSQPNRRLVHLVNYDPVNPVENVGVHVRVPKDRRARIVLLTDPKQEKDTEIPAEQHNDLATFVVPKVATYAIAAVVLE
jgi:hypothetical protein